MPAEENQFVCNMLTSTVSGCSLSASFSGLTLGIMGLDQMGLKMVIESGMQNSLLHPSCISRIVASYIFPSGTQVHNQMLQHPKQQKQSMPKRFCLSGGEAVCYSALFFSATWRSIPWYILPLLSRPVFFMMTIDLTPSLPFCSCPFLWQT